MGDLKAPRKVRRRHSPPPVPAPIPAPIVVPTRDPARRPHDGSRTRVEARVAISSLEEENEVATPTRRFNVHEITSGVPDDCREEDERAEERLLRDLRGRVKVARAIVSKTPGLAETLAGDWRKAATFYARYRISEAQYLKGVRADGVGDYGPIERAMPHRIPRSDTDGKGGVAVGAYTDPTSPRDCNWKSGCREERTG